MTKANDSDLRESLAKLHQEAKAKIEDNYTFDTTVIEGLDLASFEYGIQGELQFAHNKMDAIQEEEERAIAKGLLAKWCFEQVLHTEMVCSECVDDLATEFARQLLEEHEKPVWTDYWTLASPWKRVSSVLFYKPSETFPKLSELAGTDAFKRIVREIQTVTRSGISLDLEEYLTFLRARLRRFSSSLDTTELKIVSFLVNQSNTDNETLAKAADITPQWASRKLTELKDRSILRTFQRVPFSKIGIRMYNFFISTAGTDEDPYRLLADCPFLYSFQRVLTGQWSAFAVFCVPDNYESIRAVQSVESAFERWGFPSVLTEIASSGTVNCFDYYNPDNGEWEIPWEILGIELNRIVKEQLADLMPRVDQPANRTNIELDDLDMKILEQIRMKNTSIHGIREALSVGQQRVSDRLRRLKENELIVSTWESHNIGLYENVAAICSDVEDAKSIGAWSLRLPRAIVSYDIDKTLSIIARLPRGGSYGISRAMSDLTSTTTIGLLDALVYGAWGFPIDLWDSDNQRWLCPKDQVNEWLETLR